MLSCSRFIIIENNIELIVYLIPPLVGFSWHL